VGGLYSIFKNIDQNTTDSYLKKALKVINASLRPYKKTYFGGDLNINWTKTSKLKDNSDD